MDIGIIEIGLMAIIVIASAAGGAIPFTDDMNRSEKVFGTILCIGVAAGFMLWLATRLM